MNNVTAINPTLPQFADFVSFEWEYVQIDSDDVCTVVEQYEDHDFVTVYGRMEDGMAAALFDCCTDEDAKTACALLNQAIAQLRAVSLGYHETATALVANLPEGTTFNQAVIEARPVPGTEYQYDGGGALIAYAETLGFDADEIEDAMEPHGDDDFDALEEEAAKFLEDHLHIIIVGRDE